MIFIYLQSLLLRYSPFLCQQRIVIRYKNNEGLNEQKSILEVFQADEQPYNKSQLII